VDTGGGMNGDGGPPRWTRAGFAEGARLTLPLLPGVIVMAAAIGTISAQKGLSLIETTLMSALVFGGTSQLVALEAWSPHLGWAGVITVTLVAGTVNLRYFLMTASMRRWLVGLPAWQVYPALLFNVDANWLVAMRYHADGGRDPGIYVGSGITLWLCWTGFSIPGYLLGRLVQDSARYGLDMALILFFAAMLVPLWKGRRRALAWAFGGAVALGTSMLLPGFWFVVAGALAGGVAGGFIDEPE
jgi:predicted branched-subunit amino acid permease